MLPDSELPTQPVYPAVTTNLMLPHSHRVKTLLAEQPSSRSVTFNVARDLRFPIREIALRDVPASRTAVPEAAIDE